ncbi:hypothetical protein ALC62_09009 [Cyphomyrmex costatus]|uniref:Ionotropic glutamate receptor C-terminal domain-containing protein n=1 Tax=Cyphomyrmex costatus TaxID=456900 RepID=A0A151IG60_9HYME|nr:hypothetical protein ALC62_09009 [Cyphomyrmex costatus]
MKGIRGVVSSGCEFLKKAIYWIRSLVSVNIILKNFTERRNQRDKALKYLIPCTVTFIKEYFENPEQITLLLPNVLEDVSDVIEPLTNALYVTSVAYELNVYLMNKMEIYDALTNVVVLLENGIAFEVNNFSFVNYCEHNCNFIVVLTNLFADKESFLIEAGTLVQQMSLQSIFELQILASVGDSVLLASSLSVRTNESYALVEPAFSGRCEQEAYPAIRWQLFANKTELNANTVNAAMFDNYPFTCFDNKSNRFGGVEGSMVEEIAKNLNIKLNRESIESIREIPMNAEISLRLYNATDDLVFGGILWNSSRKMTYTTCYGMVQISWIIPIETNISLRGLVAPFDKNIWYAIFCVLIVGGLVKLFFIRDITFLDITALIFSVPVSQPTRTSSRIQFISWTLFGFFLTQAYLGSLADYLISTSDMQIETAEEIVKSGLSIGGTQQFADLLQTPDKDDMDDDVGRIIRENYFIFKRHDYSKLFADLVEGKNDSLALVVMLNLTNYHRGSNIGHGHIIKETVGNYPLAFVTRQGFPYLKEFNYQIQILVQVGLVEHWSNEATLRKSYSNKEDENHSQLDIDDILPAFFLLIMGYLGGFCLLIIEVIFHPSKLLL